MTKSTIKMSDAVRSILSNATFIDGALRIEGQLDRDLYVEVNKALEALGGKWNKAKRAHVFTDPVKAAADLKVALATGVATDEKKLYQFYPTPVAYADKMVVMVRHKLTPNARILEPSAGKGRLIASVLLAPKISHVTIVAVEMDKAHEADLMSLRTDNNDIHVHIRDFLSARPPDFVRPFDVVLMNPPFSGGQDVKHIRHAHSFLKPGGLLVAIVSAGVNFRREKDYAWVRENADEIEDNDPTLFKEAGANVRTVTVLMTRK